MSLQFLIIGLTSNKTTIFEACGTYESHEEIVRYSSNIGLVLFSPSSQMIDTVSRHMGEYFICITSLALMSSRYDFSFTSVYHKNEIKSKN